jgi:pimeloyl-ACP methyl ester carboxylesterase
LKKEFIIKDNNLLPIVGDLSFNQINSNKLVIFCHGYKGYKDWGCWNLVADLFSKNGFKFLKFNFSHNGGTVDQPIDFLNLEAFSLNNYSLEVQDVSRVIKFIKESKKREFKFKQLFIIGHSRGGGIASISAKNHNNYIKKLVTWASVSNFSNRFPVGKELINWRENGIRFVENKRTKQMMPHLYQFYEDYINNIDKLNIQKSVKEFIGDVLICHGSLDMAVNIKNAFELINCSSNSELFKIRSNHTFGSRHPWEKDLLPEELNKLCLKTISFLNKQ